MVSLIRRLAQDFFYRCGALLACLSTVESCIVSECDIDIALRAPPLETHISCGARCASSASPAPGARL